MTRGENVAVTTIQGMGGIGKTALARQLAVTIQDAFPGGVLWWTLGPQPDVMTALDVWARHRDPRADLSHLPDVASRASLPGAVDAGGPRPGLRHRRRRLAGRCGARVDGCRAAGVPDPPDHCPKRAVPN
ncbi:MAG: hypothetical protein GY856_20430 [bacterium]|nr:hypothetical protein [bacterium]